jgi:hypothetical protein
MHNGEKQTEKNSSPCNISTTPCSDSEESPTSLLRKTSMSIPGKMDIYVLVKKRTLPENLLISSEIKLAYPS